MSDIAFRRVVWKEYRVQRPLWIAIAVGTLVIELLLLATPEKLLTVEKMPALFAISLAAAAIYGLGCGATLFATERETETYDFLRALPVSRAASVLRQTGPCRHEPRGPDCSPLDNGAGPVGRASAGTSDPDPGLGSAGIRGGRAVGLGHVLLSAVRASAGSGDSRGDGGLAGGQQS